VHEGHESAHPQINSRLKALDDKVAAKQTNQSWVASGDLDFLNGWTCAPGNKFFVTINREE